MKAGGEGKCRDGKRTAAGRLLPDAGRLMPVKDDNASKWRSRPARKRVCPCRLTLMLIILQNCPQCKCFAIKRQPISPLALSRLRPRPAAPLTPLPSRCAAPAISPLQPYPGAAPPIRLFSSSHPSAFPSAQPRPAKVFARVTRSGVAGKSRLPRLSRPQYRPCLICGNQAQLCARTRRHTVAEMQAKIEEMLSTWKNSNV